MKNSRMFVVLSLLLFPPLTFAAPLSFDEACPTGSETLGRNFEGHSTTALIAHLKSAASPKDEFTRTEEYETRRLEQVRAIGAAVEDGGLCHVINFKHRSTSYDADTGTLWVPMLVDYIYFDSTRVFRSPLEKQDVRNSQYRATNGFGVSRTVFKSTYSQGFLRFEVWPTRSRILAAGGAVKGAILSLPVTVTNGDEARGLMDDMAIALTYELLPPYLTKEPHFEFPTLDSPREVEATYLSLHASATMATVFQKSTGRVFQRFRLGE